jgi:1-acyl-sn-glycerol-3-phosphate acyltransferase
LFHISSEGSKANAGAIFLTSNLIDMSIPKEFDEIRPYFDHEVNLAIQRLVKEETFLKALHFLYHGQPVDKIISKLLSIQTVSDFQKGFIGPTVKVITGKTSQGFTASGFENIDKEKAYLFISNHRDIILDSAILNVLMVDHDFETTRIAIGDNLLIAPWITDLVKLNKSFVVNRNVPVRQMLESSKRLSNYIKYSIQEDGSSVWIAQREGRTKDGDDKTQTSLIKMLAMSADPEKGLAESFKGMNILPLAISYEYDPCDVKKVTRVFYKENNIAYKKTPEDDLDNMVTGITGKKGRIHFSIGTPLDRELDQLNLIGNKNEQIQLVANLIDKQVYQHYKLWPASYIALDMLENSAQFKEHYTIEEKAYFEFYIEEKQKEIPEYKNEITRLLLKFYAYPLMNRIKYVHTGV